MSNRWILIVLLIVAVALGVNALTSSAYNEGLTQGLTMGRMLAPATGENPAPGAVPYSYYPQVGFRRPFGFGFGFLCLLIPLGLLLLFLGIGRSISWRRRWWGPGMGWGGPGPHSGEKGGPESQAGIPSMVQEWHRRMHEEASASSGPKTV